MEISRDNQMAIADTALRLLARGLCAVSLFDKRIASDIKALGGGFSFAVCAGPGAKSPSVRLKTENGRFIRADADTSCPDVTIRFKDVSGLLPVLAGGTSVETAFARHRMQVFGNINQAVALVRIITITEAYLFPKFILKKAMRRVPKKQVPRLFVYIMLLFFGTRKPPKPLAASAGELPEAEGCASPEKDGETEERLEAVK